VKFWKKRDVIPNPRSRKPGEPLWYVYSVRLMYVVNFITAYSIFLLLMWMLLS